jgi:EAL domain-containing protein (putative c-di-GMP-specific phosphodiesterase class I)
LLRWDHPVRGAIAPATFVAAAEQTGLMAKLGEFVLRRACADVRRWPGLYVAVNLSPVQVRDPALCELVGDALRQSGIAPSRLVLEITEGVLIDDPEAAKAPLAALRARGVKLALDDFGTGFSSLTYLQRFPFDKLKIDKRFVAPLGRDSTSQALIQAIVGLGRALDLAILAEGVETEEQRVLLRLAGCEQMQGFLFAHPGPREMLDRLVDAAATAAIRPALRAAG